MGPQEHKVERRLAAIFAADVAGYSRLMEQDEVGTLRSLTAHREIMDRLIAEYGGRIANTAGDSVLVEFLSAVNAVQCAVDVQNALAVAKQDLPEDHSLQFRIGVHVGDVMVRNGDLLGDGVNIAARLESIAEPGGVCISRDAYQHTRKALSLQYTDLGEQTVRNMADPVQVFLVKPQEMGSEPLMEVPYSAALPLPDKPSIAVLPFATFADNRQDGFAADGFVEDLISALSRNHLLFVIARNSSFTYKDRNADVRHVARELGVRYIIEGSLRPFGDQYRVNVQLIHGLDGHHVWAETYHIARDSFFEAHDTALRSIAASVQTQITLHEGEDFFSRPKHPQRATELLKEAWARIYQLTPQALTDARRLAEAALGQSSQNDRAHQVIAISHHHMAYLGYAENWKATVETAYREACRAVELYEPDEYSHWILGSTLVLKREHERAIAEYTRALEINPNCSMAYGSMGTGLAWAGKTEEALRVNEIAIRSNPRDPSIFLRFFVNGLAYFTACQFEEAQVWLAKTIQRKKTFRNAHLLYIASLALSGAMEAAQQAQSEMHEYFPMIGPEHLHEFPFIRSQDAAQLERGLRLAGLME